MPSDLAEIGPGTDVLGLPFTRRVVEAATRAGFERVVVLAEDEGAMRRALDGTDATVVAADAPVSTSGFARSVVLTGHILPNQAWLREQLERPIPAGGSEFEKGVVTVSEAGRDHVAMRAGLPRANTANSSGVTDVTRSPKALERRMADRRTLVLTSDTTRSDVERYVLGDLVKATDGFMARHVARPISLALTRRLAATAITPNAMTVVSVLIGLLAAPFFLSSAPEIQIIGGLLFVLHSIVDGCDGELARLRFSESRFGGLLDYWGDNLVHIAVFSCMAVGLSIELGASWPLLAGAAAVVGTLASAGLVFWRTMRRSSGPGPVFTSVAGPRKTRLVGLADALARRDFIYLVAVLSAFGKAAWFLAMAAVGAPLFFIILLVIARGEARNRNR